MSTLPKTVTHSVEPESFEQKTGQTQQYSISNVVVNSPIQAERHKENDSIQKIEKDTILQ